MTMDEANPKTDRADAPGEAGYEAPEVEDIETGGEPLATMALITSAT
jgi:hypothetical protein